MQCTGILPLGFQNSIRHFFEGKTKMSICCSHHFNGSLLTNHQNVFWTLTRLTSLFRLILLSLYKAHYGNKTRSSLSRTRDNSFRTRITFIKTNLGEIDKTRFLRYFLMKSSKYRQTIFEKKETTFILPFIFYNKPQLFAFD